MIFFPRKSGSNRSSVVRMLLMIGLFMAVGYLFWTNYEQSMDTIQTRHVLRDETDTLNEDMREKIVSFSRNLRERFGMGVQVRIFEDVVMAPPADPKIIYIGLSPRHMESAVVFPPLLRAALPDDFVDYISSEHFENSWENQAWVESLVQALNLIGREMMKIEQQE